MNTIKFDIPGEDAWVLGRLGQILSRRLIQGSDKTAVRQTLLRLLFGVQRLPIGFPELCISFRAGSVSVHLNREIFSLETFTDDNHTALRLQYFARCNHCLYWHDTLTGDAKHDAIECGFQELEEALDEGQRLWVEDLSTGQHVDEPPLADFMKYAPSYEK